MGGGLEHVLRNLSSEDAKKLIQTAPLSEIDYPLKTATLLKTLEDHLLKESISEDMLEVLEVLEKHLLDGSNPITTTMKSAYCLVAVYSTLKYLQPKSSSYLQAVDRIWRGRVLALETHGNPLFSHDLKYWKTQFEDSLLDINRFVSQLPDTRMDEALQNVRMFLDEAWDNLYASFLHPPPPIVADSQQRRRASLMKDMYAAIVDDGSTDTTTSCSKIASMSIDEDSEIGKSLQCSSMELENQELEDIINQEAQSEYHNANAYVANSQDDCQSINNYEANLKEAARSHEGGTTCNTVGVTLRRSKRKNFSPLKDPQPTEITKRRRINNWNESEVDTLRSGVLKFGRKWKQILNFYGFEKRTAVDLKDKWTNILKSEAKQNKGKRNICK